MSKEYSKGPETNLEQVLLANGFVKDTVKSGDKYHPLADIYENDKLRITLTLTHNPKSPYLETQGITDVSIFLVLPKPCNQWANPKQRAVLKPFIEALYPGEIPYFINQRLGMMATPAVVSEFQQKDRVQEAFDKKDGFGGYEWRFNKEMQLMDERKGTTFTHTFISIFRVS